MRKRKELRSKVGRVLRKEKVSWEESQEECLKKNCRNIQARKEEFDLIQLS
jgi:hypothetical protein